MLVHLGRTQTLCSFLSLLVVSFAHPSPAVAHNAGHHLQANRVKRQNGLDEPRDFQDFNINAADVFPSTPQLKHDDDRDFDKRGLVGGLVNGVVSGVGDVVGGVVTVVSVLVNGNGQTITTTQQVTTTQQGATSAAGGATNNGGSPTTTPGNTPAPPTSTSNPNNGSGNSAGSSNASQGGNGSANGTDTTTDSKAPGDTSVAGSSGTAAPINNGGSLSSGAVSRSVVTDHFGNTITGTAPVTQEWVTTLPNGVVSTVTATFTPGTPDTAPSATRPMSRGKIAAIVGTIVAMFIVIFSCALVMLLIRKRTRAIQLTRSRPNSAGSFDSFTNGDAEERRDSRVGLTVGTMSSHSFRTAPAFIDGAHMEFPLPPAPEISAAGGGRPLSGESESTDFGFTGQMSRDSVIEDRNQFRKIGEYPAAESYTPFAFPPSDDLGHSEEGIHCTYSPSAMAFAIEQKLNSVPEKSFHQDYTDNSRSETPISPAYDNPFTDNSAASTTPTTPIGGVRNSLLGNSGARKTLLWRTATLGSSETTILAPAPPRKTKVVPFSQNDGPAQQQSESQREPTIDLTRESSMSSSGSGARRSFYSATASLKEGLRVSQMYQGGDDPFADQNSVVAKPMTPQPTQGINYPVLRPGTTGTATSVTSSAVDSDIGRRDLGESPDPNGHGLFWPTSRPSTGQSPLSGQF